MLYLFNSAYRPLYLRNVLNTLYLPEGATNEYRYRFRGGDQHTEFININPASVANLRALKSRTDVVVVFVDRFGAGGYRYLPLRMGRLMLVRDDNDYMYFRVALREYIFPQNIEEFNRSFVSALHPEGVPRLTANDPLSPSDGWYAVVQESLFSQREDFLNGDAAWTACVSNLHKCPAFSLRRDGVTDEERDGREVVFLRGKIRTGRNKALVPSIIGNEGVFRLVRGENYSLDLTYHYPPQATDTGRHAVATCAIGDNLKALGREDVAIDGVSNSTSFGFTTKRYLEENRDCLSIDFRTERPNTSVLGTNAKLLFEIQEGRLFWLQMLLAVLLFSMTGVFIATDWSKVNPITLWNVFDAIWVKSLAGVAQAGLLFWLFKLVGKKFL